MHFESEKLRLCHICDNYVKYYATLVVFVTVFKNDLHINLWEHYVYQSLTVLSLRSVKYM